MYFMCMKYVRLCIHVNIRVCVCVYNRYCIFPSIGVAGAANWTGYYVMWFKPKSVPVQSFDFKNSCMQLNKVT